MKNQQQRFLIAVLWLTGLCLLGSRGPAAYARTWHAVVPTWIVSIGINDIERRPQLMLPYAVNDATAMTRALSLEVDSNKARTFQFTTDVRDHNANAYPTRSHILDCLQNVAKHASNNDSVILYISARGFVDKSGHLYIAVADTDPAHSEKTSLSFADLQQVLASIPASVTCIFDTCRDLPEQGKVGQAIPEIEIAPSDKKAPRAYLFACGQGKLAYDDTTYEHGTFTACFLQALKSAEGKTEPIGVLFEAARHWTHQCKSAAPDEQTPVLRETDGGSAISLTFDKSYFIGMVPTTWVVAVGVNKHDKSPTTDLKFADSDAEAIAAALGAEHDASADSTFLLTSERTGADYPTRENILQRLSALELFVRPTDTVIFYYSGNSAPTSTGQQMLMTANADTTSLDTTEHTALATSEVFDELRRLSANTICIFDACDGASGIVPSTSPDNHSRVCLSACLQGQIEVEPDELKHGLFTYYLLDALHKSNSGRVPLLDIFATARRGVETWAGQEKGIKSEPTLIEFGGGSIDNLSLEFDPKR